MDQRQQMPLTELDRDFNEDNNVIATKFNEFYINCALPPTHSSAIKAVLPDRQFDAPGFELSSSCLTSVTYATF